VKDFLPQLIQFNIPFIFIVFVGALAFLGSFWLYRTTIPKINVSPKYILLGIRGIVFFLILLLFFAPRFIFTFKETSKPKVAVFLDNSKSMGFDENDQSRWQIALNSIKEVNDIIPENTDLFQYTFNTQVEEITGDVINVSDYATNFSSVINNIKNVKYDKVFIVSDGNSTDGIYNLSENWPFKTQIYTIGIGKTESGVDLSISNVVFDPISYLDKETEVEVQIRSKNIQKDYRTQLKLFDHSKVIKSQIINAGKGDVEQSVKFKFKSSQLGLNKFKVEIENIDNESNQLNNSYTFVQNVLKSKLRIGLLGGAPSYDTKFISFLLNQLDDVEVFTFIEQKNGQFYKGTEQKYLDSLDVVVFCGFPGPFTNSNTLNRIKSIISQKQVPIINILNQYTSQSGIESFSEYYPFIELPNKSRGSQVLINAPTGQNKHPILLLFDKQDLNNRFWSKVPPLDIYFSGGKLKSNAIEILSGIVGKQVVPIILGNESKTLRSMVLNGEGFWKWYFLFQDEKELLPGYSRLLNYMIRWVSDKAKIKPVVLETNNRVVNLGEKIIINGYIYDANFNPVYDGNLLVQAEWNNQEFNLESTNDSSGNYLIEFIPPGEGKYNINARGFKEDVELGIDRLEIEVVPIEKEFIRVEQNVDFLKRLAEMSDGYYVNSSNLDSLKDALLIEEEIKFSDRIYEVWYEPIILGLILLLITVEWIMRKRLGLV